MSRKLCIVYKISSGVCSRDSEDVNDLVGDFERIKRWLLHDAGSPGLVDTDYNQHGSAKVG